MNSPRYDVLEATVAIHDRHGGPVSVADLADQTGIEEPRVAEYLEAFERCALVRKVPHEDGVDAVVPTVTAREFLRLDLDAAEFVVLEPADREEGGPS